MAVWNKLDLMLSDCSCDHGKNVHASVAILIICFNKIKIMMIGGLDAGLVMERSMHILRLVSKCCGFLHVRLCAFELL